jgi:hypothetical protein
MNCKPGDLAIVVRHERGGSAIKDCHGMILEVLYLAPPEPFNLPDGQRSTRGSGTEWVVKAARPIPVRMPDGSTRMAQYGKAFDAFLRPIRPGDITDEEVRDLYAPKVPEAA